ncbi:hypothetical protein DFJ74DRAFT_735484 [Hyaloraphidium curvatum]|nr:hypothetical protein DFJ74DRAFT_735484 [Hyaloraphidium curvatum]
MATTDAAELPPEILYRIAQFLRRRWQLEFARASRGIFELLAPLAFYQFRCWGGPQPAQLDHWETNDWLGHLRHVDLWIMSLERTQDVAVAMRVFQQASRLRSVDLYFEEPYSWAAVLRALPESLRSLDVNDNVGEIGDELDFSLPFVRCLRYQGSNRYPQLPVLKSLLNLCPGLEELALDIWGEEGLDVLGFLDPSVVRKVTGWTVEKGDGFRTACTNRWFRPRHVDNRSESAPSSLEPETLAMIARLPSIKSLDICELASKDILECGLPAALEELEVTELVADASLIDGGLGRLSALLASRPRLRIRVDNIAYPENVSEEGIAGCAEEAELWRRRIGRRVNISTGMPGAS